MDIKAPKNNLLYRNFFCNFCIDIISTNDYWYSSVHKKPIAYCPKCGHVCREMEALNNVTEDN